VRNNGFPHLETKPFPDPVPVPQLHHEPVGGGREARAGLIVEIVAFIDPC
jgi:hypothetical protein